MDPVTWSVTGLLGHEAGTMLAGQLFASLMDLEPERREALLGVLRAWFGGKRQLGRRRKGAGT